MRRQESQRMEHDGGVYPSTLTLQTRSPGATHVTSHADNGYGGKPRRTSTFTATAKIHSEQQRREMHDTTVAQPIDDSHCDAAVCSAGFPCVRLGTGAWRFGNTHCQQPQHPQS